MELKKLHSGETEEFGKLIEIFKEVFENTAEASTEQQRRKLLSNPDFMVFIVRINDAIVGGLTVYVLHSCYSPNPTAYIYDVGVAPAFQGKGIGKKLINEVCKFFKKSGFDEVYVEAESDDVRAIDFYRKTKPSSELPAIHFTYSLKE